MSKISEDRLLESKIKQGSMIALKSYLENSLKENTINLEATDSFEKFRFFQGQQFKLREIIKLLP